jgi:uncharacterized membrane protein YkvA (DUF1232 family)
VNWREWARQLKTETLALYLAYRDPRAPWYARVVIVLVVAYAFSPIDLIPDFIPVLGYLDDLVLLPLGIALAIRLLPADLLADCREQARQSVTKPTSRTAALVIIAIWLLAGVMVIHWLTRLG